MILFIKYIYFNLLIIIYFIHYNINFSFFMLFLNNFIMVINNLMFSLDNNMTNQIFYDKLLVQHKFYN